MRITRRRVLQGLLATPVAIASSALLGCSRKSAVETKGATVNDAQKAGVKQYLNVILHGLTAVIVPDRRVTPQAQGIEIWIPTQTGHEYLWGPWCAEVDLPYGVTQVKGIEGNPQTFLDTTQSVPTSDLDPNYDAVLEKCRLSNVGPKDLRCLIKLPFPLEIWQLRRVCMDSDNKDFLAGDYEAPYGHTPPTAISMVHAFRYRITDLKSLSYGDHALTIGTDPSVNLHIWADPASAAHTTQAQKQTPVESMVQFLTGMKISQNSQYRDRSGELRKDELRPTGMDYTETYTRAERGNCKNIPTLNHDCRHEYHPDNRAKIVHCMSLFAYNPANFTPAQAG
jgi:hypothetical protein